MAKKYDMETNSFPEEYFTNGKEKQVRNEQKRKKRKKNMAQMLAASTALVVGVVAVEYVENLPKYIQPEAMQITLTDYEAPVTNEDGTYTSGWYLVGFTFKLNDAIPVEVKITGEEELTLYSRESATEGPIEVTIPYEELTVDGDRVIAYYGVDDVYSRYTLTATLYYDVKNDDTDAVERRSISTEPYVSSISYMVANEGISKNSFEYVLDNDVIHCKATFTDFVQGSFEYKATDITIYYGENQIIIGDDYEEKLNMPSAKDGKLVYEFDLPYAREEVIELHVEVMGDNYFSGVAMDVTSHSYIATSLLFGETYAIEGLTMPQNLSANGLTVTNYQILAEYTNLSSHSTKAHAGSEVTVMVYLEGSALVDGTIQLQVILNNQKITISNLEYCTTSVTAGDTYVTLEFTFTMPTEDVSAQDIVLEALTILE